MKLYTEEQVKEMLSMTDNIDIDGDLFTHNDIISSQIPIELPNDEEIEEILGTAGGGLFAKGAKWAIEQIKQQEL